MKNNGSWVKGERLALIRTNSLNSGPCQRVYFKCVLWLQALDIPITWCSVNTWENRVSEYLQHVAVQLLSCVRLFETPWTAAHQPSLSIINSQSLLKFMSINWWCHPTISSCVVPFSCLQSFPASGSFPMSLGASAVYSIFKVNTVDKC